MYFSWSSRSVAGTSQGFDFWIKQQRVHSYMALTNLHLNYCPCKTSELHHQKIQLVFSKKMNSLTKTLSCKWAYLRLFSCSFSNCYMINAQLDAEITPEAINKKKAGVGLDISLCWLMPSERRRIHANISRHTSKPQEAKCPIWTACGHLINCFSGWKKSKWTLKICRKTQIVAYCESW